MPLNHAEFPEPEGVALPDPPSLAQPAAQAGDGARGIRTQEDARLPRIDTARELRAAGTGAETGAPPETKLICLAVAYGDTLWGIARLFGTTVSAIAQMNGIADPDRIFPGQRLYLRVPAAVPIAACTDYAVRPGDTLWDIAQRFGLDTAALARANHLFDPDLIYPGQVLRIDGAPAVQA